ncbi:flagella basal body P-ring formation protein FlgA [Sphingomonas sp. CJ20]
MFLVLALVAAPVPLAAEPFQSTTALDAIVTQFTGQPIGSEGGAMTPVDGRLKLAACPAPQLSWRTDAHDAVVVRCMAPAWRIFVPVKAAPRPAPVATPNAVAVRPAPVVKAEPVIRRGDLITIAVGATGFSISRDGVAMNDAAAGARVAVKIDDKKPPIQAIALEPGRAKLPGWSD